MVQIGIGPNWTSMGPVSIASHIVAKSGMVVAVVVGDPLLLTLAPP
jgi:hypothetical protein